jgi:hypothetical protein
MLVLLRGETGLGTKPNALVIVATPTSARVSMTMAFLASEGGWRRYATVKPANIYEA